jgi:3',5'-cyclic AMP phosphodiesterase CpdA
MKILHVSDSHVTNSEQFNLDSLQYALRELEEGDFDLFIHSGDVTNRAKREQFDRAAELFSSVDVPRVIIPGNHDKRSGGLPMFKQKFGSPKGVKKIDDTLVVFLDSAVNDQDDGRVGKLQFNMLKENLSRHDGISTKIVVLHHHIIPIPWTGKERNVLSNAGDLLELFLRTDVDLVLSGHKHFPNSYKIEGTVFVNAGTVSDKKTRYGDTNSYNVIEIDRNRTRVKVKRDNGHEKTETYERSEKRVFTDFGGKISRLAQISNTFISDTYRFRSTTFSDGVSHLNELNPDLVVHAGGVVEEAIPKNYRLARSLLDKISAPIVFTPASRDINYLGYQLFKENFGEMDQEYSLEGVYLKGISSAQYDSEEGIVGETERARLFQEMNEIGSKMKILFLHHNVLPIPHSREKGLLEDGGDLLRGSVESEVDLVLTGTSSHPFATKINDTIVSNANSFSSVYQRSLNGNSFNLIDIYEKAVVIFEINCLWGTQKILGIWERTR